MTNCTHFELLTPLCFIVPGHRCCCCSLSQALPSQATADVSTYFCGLSDWLFRLLLLFLIIRYQGIFSWRLFTCSCSSGFCFKSFLALLLFILQLGAIIFGRGKVTRNILWRRPFYNTKAYFNLLNWTCDLISKIALLQYYTLYYST